MAEKREDFPYGNLNIFTEAVTLILDKLDDIAAGGGGGGSSSEITPEDIPEMFDDNDREG